VAAGGCGFQSRSGGAVGSGSDAGPGGDIDAGAAIDAAMTDAPIDGAPAAPGCFQQWIDNKVMISAAAVDQLMALNSNGDDRDPWISGDGKRLYFARSPGTKGMSDVYRTTRASTSVEFGDGSEVTNLNSNEVDDRPALNGDETQLVVSTERNPSDTRARIAISVRPNTGVEFGAPDERHLDAVNAGNVNRYDPFLSEDGLRLYFAPASGPAGRQEITVAVRTAVDGNFVAPGNVGGINSANTSNADPALAYDERILVFTSDRGSGGDEDLYYATRDDRTKPFKDPRPIPVVNSGDSDGDPMLSSDGCELYFASRRVGGHFHLYRARLTQ
jgi:Tol biopolymer transport system component